MDLVSWIGVIAGLIGSLITIVIGMRKFHSYVITPVLNHFKTIHACVQDIAEIKKKLAYELNPNGGNSLKDLVQKYGQQVLRIEGIVLAILSSSDKGVWISDEFGRSVWLSHWFDKKLGWDIVDMIGNGWKNAIHPDDRDKVAKEFSESVKDGRDFIMDYRYIHKADSNKSIKIHAVCHPIKKTSGEIIGFVGFVTELSKD